MTSLRRNRYVGGLATALVLAAPVAVPAAASAASGGTLTVSKSTGLAVGDKVTVSAKGLSPSQGFVPIGLCKPKPAGPTDCDTSPESAVIGKTDSSGVWHSAASNATTAQITVKAKAAGADCTAKAGNCVIAVSISATSELVEVPLTVSAGGQGTSSPRPSDSATATTGGGGTATTGGGSTSTGGSEGSLPRTGSTDGLPVASLLGGTLLLFGGCSLVLLRRRPRD
ncbi:neocarzinostatin apoprotein domain-containing protein [Streptomyces sp. NPDC001914]|uniref:neocarzinostatin apoprotein domain-containing protein n=1 Tax=Streptomyces sp. NPDC001914 TaxID=3364623 RepID=UPI0036B852E1